MEQGRGGMGTHKHGATGWKRGATKSPRMRLWEKMRAEKNERKRRKAKMYASIKDAMKIEAP